MLITEHDDIHGNFEGVEKPDKDTMEGYLEEAKIISELNMCVSGVRKTNADIDEGRVLKHRLNRCRGRQEEKVQTIYRNIELSVSFSLIQEEVTRMAVENALLLPHIDESLVVGHAA